jgi:hypothetical protein
LNGVYYIAGCIGGIVFDVTGCVEDVREGVAELSAIEEVISDILSNPGDVEL